MHPFSYPQPPENSYRFHFRLDKAPIRELKAPKKYKNDVMPVF